MNKQELINKIKLIDGFDGSESKDWNRGFVDGLYATVELIEKYEDKDKSIVEIPQCCADWIERQKQSPDENDEYTEYEALSDSIHFTIYRLYAKYTGKNKYTEKNSDLEARKSVLGWLEYDRSNYFKLVDAVRYGYRILVTKWLVSEGDLVVRKGKHEAKIYIVEYIDEESVLLANGIQDEFYSDNGEEASAESLDYFYENFRLLAKKENLEEDETNEY